MPRIVRGGLIQATLCERATSPIEKIREAMIDKHVALIDRAWFATDCQQSEC
jgi:N-carbamoylputrescine amidase